MGDPYYYYPLVFSNEGNSFCSSSDVPFSIRSEYAYNNNNDPLIWREQDFNAPAAYNDSSEACKADSLLYSHGYAANSAATMHPNMAFIDIDINGRNYDHNQASAGKTASQHGDQSHGECSRGDSNSRRYDEDDNIATVPVDLIQNRRPFKCSHGGCNKTFKNPQTLKIHHKTHLSAAVGNHYSQPLYSATNSRPAGHDKKIPSRCPICRKTFVGLYELRRHCGRKHSNGEKMHGCKKCDKRFYIEVDLRDHEKLCGEPVECKCGMKFAFKCNLVAHKKSRPECNIDNNFSSTSFDQANCKSSSNSSIESKRPCRPASNSCQSISNVLQLHEMINFRSISGALLPNLGC